jgi:hypothetical protein
MNMRLRYILTLGLAIASMAAALEQATADPNATPVTDVASIKVAAAREEVIKAVIYSLPLVLMDITMQRAIGLPRNGVATPINQFGHMRAFPTAAFKEVVRANVDTLYSSAFLDLSSGPLVLSVPDTQDRYYLMPLMDAWTNVFATPGKRTTGTRAGNFLITGPDWIGSIPAGMQQFKSPTNMVWILGRTQTNGIEDYAAVHAIQDGYKLTPLASWGQAYVLPRGSADPTLDRNIPPVEQLKKMSAIDYFNRLSRLLKSNPPPASEAPILAKLASIGIKPGERFDTATLDPEIAKGLDGSVATAIEKLEQGAKQTGQAVNGWRVPAQGCNDSRILATSADETGEALLPQLVRMKFTTSATSLSESRQAKRGIVNCAGVRAVRGVCDPSRTMEMSDRGFPACTTGLPARRGNTCSYPTPSGRWHAAQLSR